MINKLTFPDSKYLKKKNKLLLKELNDEIIFILQEILYYLIFFSFF